VPKVLVIEDEAAVRKLIVMAFADVGYDVSEAVDGPEGIQRATQEKFDLVVLDVLLPKIDGRVVLEQIRREYEVPFLVVTASDRAADDLRWSVGIANTFTKPFEIDDLVERADEVLGISR
jgi:CheY-like chemotaxis protein